VALLDSGAHRFNGQVLCRRLAVLFAVAMAASTDFIAKVSVPALVSAAISTYRPNFGLFVPKYRPNRPVFVFLDFHSALNAKMDFGRFFW
jgi:hypothetical protein